MKQWTFERDLLSACLARLKPIVGTSTIAPILAHAMIRPVAGGAEFRVSNIDSEIAVTIQAVDTFDAPMTIPFAPLRDLVSNFSAGSQVSIGLESSLAVVRSGRASAKLPVLDPVDFPTFDSFSGAASFEIDGARLAQALGNVAPAISTVSARHYLCGAHFLPISGSLVLEATDSHRAVRTKLDVAVVGKAPSSILPAAIISALRGSLRAGAECQVEMSDTKMAFRQDNWRCASKLIDGQFPDVAQALDGLGRPEIFAKMNADSLLAAIRRVSIVSEHKSRAVKMTLENNTVRISASSNGEAEDEFDAEYSGDPMSLLINADYARQALDGLGSIRVALTDRAMWIDDEANPATERVIMGQGG